jgi:hypothetical protein
MPIAFERRTSADSISPCSRKISAIRFTVAMNQVTSPALAFAIKPQTVLVAMASPEEPFGLPNLGLLVGCPRVGFDDLGGEQGFEPGPRQPGNGWGDRCIDVHRR